MNRTIIIVALNLRKDGSGYDTRVRMECELLKKDYSVVILTDPNAKDIDWMDEYVVERFVQPKNNIPKLRVLSYIHSLRTKLKQLLDKYPDAVIYCESLMPLIYSRPVVSKRDNKLVYDCHGAQPAEREYKNPGLKGRVWGRFLYSFEQSALKRCNLIITVTDKQYELFKTKTPYVKFPMVPASMFFDNNCYKERIRKELNIPEDYEVYIYSGGVDKWQMCEETIAIYKTIEETKNESFLLVLSKASDTFKALIKNYDIKNYAVLKSKYEDVPKYLDACDYGFCIREDNIVNNVASPTKILEYLSRDVKPIITNCIGDFSCELRDQNLACVVDIDAFEVGSIEKDESFCGRTYVESIREQYINDFLKAIREL